MVTFQQVRLRPLRATQCIFSAYAAMSSACRTASLAGTVCTCLRKRQPRRNVHLRAPMMREHIHAGTYRRRWRSISKKVAMCQRHRTLLSDAQKVAGTHPKHVHAPHVHARFASSLWMVVLLIVVDSSLLIVADPHQMLPFSQHRSSTT